MEETTGAPLSPGDPARAAVDSWQQVQGAAPAWN